MKYFKFSILGLFSLLLLTNCSKSSVVVGENITTVRLNLKDKGVVKTVTYKDIDGIGGNTPIVDTIYLYAENLVECSVDILDESQQPAASLTAEIVAESNEHLFLYTSTISDLQVAYNDTDDFSKNFGMKTLWKTAVQNTTKYGTLTVILKHEPTNKDDLANPGGETDIEVTFPVKYN
jgi:hypothetical protein